MQDRRSGIRRKTYLGGKVAFNHRYSTMDCLLRDMDEGGARLDFRGTPTLPAEFDLQIAKLDRSYRARLRWQRGREVGVTFLGSDRTGQVVSLGQAVRIRQLEADKVRLERRISELTSLD